VNFWVTPAEANLKPERGGLVICKAAPPESWAIKGYDADKARIVTFSERNADSMMRVPYSCNRAALFVSRLFHYSDAPEFKSGHENKRINVTLLYGKKGNRPPSIR
jgi:hypothetical protein